MYYIVVVSAGIYRYGTIHICMPVYAIHICMAVRFGAQGFCAKVIYLDLPSRHCI